MPSRAMRARVLSVCKKDEIPVTALEKNTRYGNAFEGDESVRKESVCKKEKIPVTALEKKIPVTAMPSRVMRARVMSAKYSGTVNGNS